jgi:hypothetical protein
MRIKLSELQVGDCLFETEQGGYVEVTRKSFGVGGSVVLEFSDMPQQEFHVSGALTVEVLRKTAVVTADPARVAMDRVRAAERELNAALRALPDGVQALADVNVYGQGRGKLLPIVTVTVMKMED